MMPSERGLQGRQRLVVGKTLDGDDLGALGLHRKDQASPHRLAIEQDRAGAAHAVLAAHMGAGEAQLVAQAVDERHARLDLDRDWLSVDFEVYRHGDANAWSTLSPACGGGLGRGLLLRAGAVDLGRSLALPRKRGRGPEAVRPGSALASNRTSNNPSARRTLQRTLDHGADQRPAIGGARVNIALRVHGRRSSCTRSLAHAAID